MDDIVLARTLRAQGYNSDEVRRLKDRGELNWLRRGVYVRDGTTDLSVEQPWSSTCWRRLYFSWADRLESGQHGGRSS